MKSKLIKGHNIVVAGDIDSMSPVIVSGESKGQDSVASSGIDLMSLETELGQYNLKSIELNSFFSILSNTRIARLVSLSNPYLLVHLCNSAKQSLNPSVTLN